LANAVVADEFTAGYRGAFGLQAGTSMRVLLSQNVAVETPAHHELNGVVHVHRLEPHVRVIRCPHSEEFIDEPLTDPSDPLEIDDHDSEALEPNCHASSLRVRIVSR
jgi:hypothetical protein